LISSSCILRRMMSSRKVCSVRLPASTSARMPSEVSSPLATALSLHVHNKWCPPACYTQLQGHTGDGIATQPLTWSMKSIPT
jgi:hypothetical protein